MSAFQIKIDGHWYLRTIKMIEMTKSLPPPLVHRPVKDHYRPGGGRWTSPKIFACSILKSDITYQNIATNQGGGEVDKPGRWGTK